MEEKQYTWEDLAKYGDPNKWIEIYQQYQDLLVDRDTIDWYIQEQLLVPKEKVEEQRKELIEKAWKDGFNAAHDYVENIVYGEWPKDIADEMMIELKEFTDKKYNEYIKNLDNV